MSYQRHNLCFLKRDTTPQSTHSSKELHLFDWWIEQSLPLICTRQPALLDKDKLQLAIPFFDEQNQEKIRVSYIIHKSQISYSEGLPYVYEVLPDLIVSSQVDIHVYGSYCWQYLTQKKYVNHASDLDILIYYQHESLNELSNLYEHIKKQTTAPQIDGEVRFAHWGDCAWLELIKPSCDSLLFKSVDKVELISREHLYAAFPSLHA